MDVMTYGDHIMIVLIIFVLNEVGKLQLGLFS